MHARSARSEILFSYSVDQCADVFTHRHSHYIPGGIQIENPNGQPVVAAHGNGGGIHHAQVFGQDLQIAHLVVHYGVGELERVLIVDAVDAGGLSDNFGVDLQRAQCGRGVGREVGVGGSGGEDDDASFFQVPDGAPADV